ncbi:hypothetical protein AURDEDRAFT_164583 [Auricularia subglabra TFB-10046 SS5]|nr:hypothetical protein AURDEDRAFT_164583 [Auricularia subglabra TFB-10046 SS5]
MLMVPPETAGPDMYDHIFQSVANITALPADMGPQPRDDNARFLLTNMDGPLELSFLSPNARYIHLSVAASAPARRRTLDMWEPRFRQEWPHEALFTRENALRITSLRLYMHLTYLAVRFEEMPLCETLDIIIDLESFPPATNLPLPSLKTVILRTIDDYPNGRMDASAEELDFFLTGLLGPQVNRLTLRLQGIRVFGNSRFL